EQEKAYYRRTRIFPIMHTVAIRRDVYRANPWVAQSLYKAFAAAKAKALEMGEDWWPYGLAPNRHVLDAFLRYHHEQGLSPRRFAPEELFAKETLETYKV